jgi:hypothetical protein
MAPKEHRMSKWAPIVLALALASAAPLEAADVGSTELVRQCKYPRQGKRTIDENADALQCLSYIDGFVAGASIVAGPRPFCIPATMTLVQEADAYLAWAGKHADTLTQPRYVSLQRAFGEAFPCPK